MKCYGHPNGKPREDCYAGTEDKEKCAIAKVIEKKEDCPKWRE